MKARIMAWLKRQRRIGDLLDPPLVGYNIGGIVGAIINRQWLLGGGHTLLIGTLLLFRAMRHLFETKRDTATVKRAMAADMYDAFKKAHASGQVVFGGAVDVPHDDDEGTKH